MHKSYIFVPYHDITAFELARSIAIINLENSANSEDHPEVQILLDAAFASLDKSVSRHFYISKRGDLSCLGEIIALAKERSEPNEQRESGGNEESDEGTKGAKESENP